jgi:zinc protease
MVRVFLALTGGLASLVLSFAALAQGVPAAALPAGVSAGASVEGIVEYRLANGLQVLLAPDASKPSTTVNLTLRVGSRHENYGETGMAHLLEHLVFKGTPTTRNAWAEFTRRGLRANGTTWLDRTNYFASFTANDEHLNWYVGWLADAMVNSFIAREDLASEMTVVRNEMEMGENNAGRVLMQRTLATMYEWHNYGNSTIGARSDVENVDIARLQAFYRLHYQPDNATLIVAGRFDPAAVLARVAASFGPIPRPQRVLPATYTLDPAQDGERQVTVRRAGGAPFVMMAHHLPPGSHPDYAAATLLAQVLGDTPGGRLHKALVEQRLAAGAFGFALALAEPGAMLVGAQLAPDQDIDRARAAMAALLDGIAQQPITAEELERARRQWLNAWEQGFTDPEVIGIALSEAIALGDWRLYFLQRDQVRRVTLADIQRVAVERLRQDNRTVGLYRPVAEPQRAPAPARADVAALLRDFKGDAGAAQAEVFEATPANLERRVQRSRLPGGLAVALLPKGTRGRAVQARLHLHFGDAKSLQGQETAALAAASLLDKGAEGLSRQQIADRFDALRAQVGFTLGGQTLTVTIDTVREHLPATIELVGRLLRTPTFPEDALEELRQRALASLAESRREPEEVAANAIGRLGNPYPRGDLRYVPTFEEQESDLKGVTAAQVRAFHRRFFSAAKGEFAAVGDLDAAAVTRALEAAFGSWSVPAGGAQPWVRMPRPLYAVPPGRLMLPVPDKQNAVLHAVLPLPLSDNHADFVPVMLANHILGAGGSSRLWKRIRETEGLSYDVGSRLMWSSTEDHSPWVSTAIFAPGNQARVERAWREELERSVKEGFTAAELEEARSSLLNFRRLSRAQDAAVAASAVGHLHLGRTFALTQQVDERIATATLEQVNAAWRRHFDPARVAAAWSGDFGRSAP